MRKYFQPLLPFLLILLLLTKTVQAQLSTRQKKAVEGLEKCLQKGDYTLLKPYLSPQFKTGGLSQPMAGEAVEQIIAEYPRLIASSVNKQADNQVELTLEFEQVGPQSSTLTFDDEEGLLGISFFDSVLEQSEAARAEIDFTPIVSMRTPFELVGGLIFVKAKLNGKTVDFILDSGAPSVILNAAHFKNRQSEDTFQGVAGAGSLSSIEIESFDWQGIQAKSTSFIGVDLNHLEANIGRKITGLIGHQALQDYIMVIDYDNSELLLTTQLPRLAKKEQSMPFAYQGHIPVIETSLNGKPYAFGLDTGAEVNLAGLGDYQQMPSQFIRVIQREELVGADGQVVQVDNFSLLEFQINNRDYAGMKFVASDISQLNAGYELQINGLLGYPFLSRYKVAVDFKTERIYFLEQ